MLFDSNHTQYIFDEYERRVQTHLMERAALKARAVRANALAQLAGQCAHLAAGLATTSWRWALSTLQRVRWMLPSPYGSTPKRETR
jgi:hypothetical protein